MVGVLVRIHIADPGCLGLRCSCCNVYEYIKFVSVAAQEC